MGAGTRFTSVIEIANDADPPAGVEAYQVAAETPLYDYRYSPPEEESPAPLAGGTPGAEE